MTTDNQYKILFYVKANGECLVEQFLGSQPVKAAAKIFKWFQLLEEQGPNLPRPYADRLRNKIYELRVVFGGDQYRILYFFCGKTIVLTHGFIKKTQRVPEEEIELAIRIMKDFQERTEKGETGI